MSDSQTTKSGWVYCGKCGMWVDGATHVCGSWTASAQMPFIPFEAIDYLRRIAEALEKLCLVFNVRQMEMYGVQNYPDVLVTPTSTTGDKRPASASLESRRVDDRANQE